MIGVVLADDHGLLRAGLRAMLNAEPDIHVVGEAADGVEALALAGFVQPDVLLADLSMPGPSGIEIARTLCARGSRTRVVIVTMHEDPQLVHEAAAAGAAGFITKRAAEAELITVVRRVAAGDVCLTCDTLLDHIDRSTQLGAGLPPELDAASVILLRHLGAGETDAQIAEDLGQSREEIACRRQQLCDDLGIRSRVGLMLFARDHGLC